MAVIPSSQLNLCRQRKLLATALQAQDWDTVKTLDLDLVESVTCASEDPARDLSILLKELRVVVELYRSILSQCDKSTRELASQFVK